MRPVLAILIVAAASLAGCTPIDTTFGDAAKTDYSLQTINPDPKPVTAEAAVMEGGSGTHAAGAAERLGELLAIQSATMTMPVSST